jgi:hypothetical protein
MRSLLPLTALCLVACGTKNAQVVEQEASAAAAMRERAAKVAASIAAAGDPQPCSDGVKPNYAPKSDADDADWIMFGELDGSKSDALDFNFTDVYLHYYLDWLDPKGEYFLGRAGSADQKATPLVLQTMKRVKGLKYLLVVRDPQLDRAAGTLTIDVWRATLDPPKAVCGFRLTASADPKLGVQDYDVVQTNTRTGERKVVRSDSTDEFKNALYTDAKKKVFDAAPAKVGAPSPPP